MTVCSASRIGTAVSLAILLTFIVVEDEKRPDLESSSADFQESIQSSSEGLKVFFVIIAYAALIVTFAVESVVYYYIRNANFGLNCVLATTLGSSLANVLKLAYCRPRPYWAYDQVEALSCEKGWGDPSGHALFTAAVWLFVGAVLVRRGKWLWTPLVVLWVLLVGFDRVYLGVHFYSQVLLGWVYGLGVTVMAMEYAKVKWLGLAGKYRYPLALAYHLCALGYAAIPLLLYAYRDPDWSQAWSDRIQSKCNVSYSVSDAQSSVFIESALFAFFPGAVLGFLLTRKSFISLDLSVLSKKVRVMLTIGGFIPLLLQGGVCKPHIVTLCKSYLSDYAYAGWVVTLVVSYISGLLFILIGPIFNVLFSCFAPPLSNRV